MAAAEACPVLFKFDSPAPGLVPRLPSKLVWIQTPDCTLEKCATLCLGDSKCAAFAFRPPAKKGAMPDCRIHSSAKTSKNVRSAEFVFYARQEHDACIAPPAATSTSTTTPQTTPAADCYGRVDDARVCTSPGLCPVSQMYAQKCPIQCDSCFSTVTSTTSTSSTTTSTITREKCNGVVEPAYCAGTDAAVGCTLADFASACLVTCGTCTSSTATTTTVTTTTATATTHTTTTTTRTTTTTTTRTTTPDCFGRTDDPHVCTRKELCAVSTFYMGKCPVQCDSCSSTTTATTTTSTSTATMHKCNGVIEPTYCSGIGSEAGCPLADFAAACPVLCGTCTSTTGTTTTTPTTTTTRTTTTSTPHCFGRLDDKHICTEPGLCLVSGMYRTKCPVQCDHCVELTTTTTTSSTTSTSTQTSSMCHGTREPAYCGKVRSIIGCLMADFADACSVTCGICTSTTTTATTTTTTTTPNCHGRLDDARVCVQPALCGLFSSYKHACPVQCNHCVSTTTQTTTTTTSTSTAKKCFGVPEPGYCSTIPAAVGCTLADFAVACPVSCGTCTSYYNTTTMVSTYPGKPLYDVVGEFVQNSNYTCEFKGSTGTMSREVVAKETAKLRCGRAPTTPISDDVDDHTGEGTAQLLIYDEAGNLLGGTDEARAIKYYICPADGHHDGNDAGTFDCMSGCPHTHTHGHGHAAVHRKEEAGQAAFTSAGTRTWTAPFCGHVSVVAVGGGAGGYPTWNYGGGGGGGLGWIKQLSVVKGTKYTVVVGAGGSCGGGIGGISYFHSTATVAGHGGKAAGVLPL